MLTKRIIFASMLVVFSAGLFAATPTPNKSGPLAVEGTITATGAIIGSNTVKNNFTANAAPAITDDVTAGYAIGSRWIYADTIYTCTASTAGAAIWSEGGTGTATVADLEFTSANLSGGVLAITGVKTIGADVYVSGVEVEADSITYGSTSTAINLSSYGTITGTWKIKYAQGLGADSTVNNYSYSNYGHFWPANAFPQDWKESGWSNIGSARPAIDYDQLAVPVWRVDYNLNEGMGIFLIDAIPANTTNIVITITAKPYATAAGVMAWKADYVRYRAGTAATAIATAQLGSTTLNATGVTQGSYTIALSTLSATTGDQLAFVIYPDTSISGRAATDWMILSISIKAN